MTSKTVRQISTVLIFIAVAVYGGFNWWWSAQTKALDAAARPVIALERFDTSNAIIPVDRILSGGPLPDGIPSIDEPNFVDPAAVDFLRDGDEVIVFSSGEETRIYPFRILVWHEIINDQIGEVAIAVTYCPLCGTSMVFDRSLNGETLEFGVSGLLYNSDVLMYDRQTESLWTQLGRKAVSGQLVGNKLAWLPSLQMTWVAAKDAHPDARVLSLETGYQKHYESEAYAAYKNSPQNTFPVTFSRDELPRKAWIIGVEVNGRPKAYAVDSFTAETSFNDVVEGVELNVFYNPGTQLAKVVDRETQKPIPNVRAYWFAWQAFYPETLLWRNSVNLEP